jgi:UDP-N-acetylmuramoyl-tripeptide--D-alanyl-D-alanine ligase
LVGTCGVFLVNTPTIGWLCQILNADAPGLPLDMSLLPISIDSRTLQRGDTFWALQANRDGHDFVADAIARGARCAVVNREWKNASPANIRDRLIGVRDTRTDLASAASTWRKTLTMPVLGITGSNGKTSTKELILNCLARKWKTGGTKGNLNNEIGVPLTLLTIACDDEIAVIEMGASRPGDIAYLCEIAAPTHALVTSIGRAHLEGFGTLENVARTKGELYDFVAESGTAYVPADDEWCRAAAAHCRRIVGYSFERMSSSAERHFSGENLMFDDIGCAHFDFEHVPIRVGIPGRPAALAALAALTVARTFDVPAEECRNVIDKWQAIPGRSNVIALSRLLLMDDSYNANPASMKSALETLSLLRGAHHAVILGDMAELGDFAEDEHRKLGRELAAHKLSGAALIGPLMQIAAREAEQNGLAATHFAGVEAFVDGLPAFLQNADAVLVKGSRAMRMERVVDAIKAEMN